MMQRVPFGRMTGRGVTAIAWLTALTFLLAACDSDSEETGTSVGSDASVVADVGSGVETCTSAADCDDGDACTEDSCSTVGICEHTPLMGDLPTGSPCIRNCDCEGGLCYGEAYLAPNRFCTKRCGGPGEGCGQDGTCLLFNFPAWATEFGLTITDFCMPRCTSVDDCTALNAAFNACPAPNFTEWNGKTVGSPSCTIIE